MISFFVGLVGAITALVGWFGFQSVTFLIIGTVLYVVETLMEWQALNSNAKKVDIIIFTVGAIVAVLFTSVPWYVGGMVAIAIYSLVMGVIGLIGMLKFFF